MSDSDILMIVGGVIVTVIIIMQICQYINNI